MSDEKGAFDYRAIDDILHSRIRLAVVSVLARCEEAEFTWVRDTVGATDGNLTTHCRKLEDAGYIAIDKRFVDRKPATFFRLTDTGRAALLEYARRLASFIQMEGNEHTKE
jgi:DNA-binding MarR family transcriptional regulator